MLSRFHLIPERNGLTGGQTELLPGISISRVSVRTRVSVLTRDKNQLCLQQCTS